MSGGGTSDDSRCAAKSAARAAFLFTVGLILLFSQAFASLLGAQTNSGSDPLAEAAKQLAERVAGISGLHGGVRVEFPEKSEESQRNFEDLREEFVTALERRHLTLSQEASAPLIQVRTAETPTQLVLAARVHFPDREEIRIISTPKAQLTQTELPAAPVRIDKQLAYVSADRILDAASSDDVNGLGVAVLLQRGEQIIVERTGADGQVEARQALNAAGLRPTRDPRGELVVKGSNWQVMLPGKVCEFTLKAGEEPKCHATKQNWRESINLDSPCDANYWQVFSDGGDWAGADALQLAPIGESRESSAALVSNMPGPVLSVNEADEPGAAFVVARNLATGNYEVYRVTLACAN